MRDRKRGSKTKNGVFRSGFVDQKKYIAFLKTRPTLMRDRKRKIPDRKSVVFDFTKSFSFREQKLSCVRPKIRLGFSCGVSGMPTVGIIRNLKFEYTCTHAAASRAI